MVALQAVSSAWNMRKRSSAWSSSATGKSVCTASRQAFQEITGGRSLPVGGMYYADVSLLQRGSGRILLGISHYRDVRPMTSDLDMALFDEAWLAGADGG